MRNERGSALLIALIVALIVVGIGGALLADTLARQGGAHRGAQSDEAQMLAESGLERARRALFVYRDQNLHSWDDLLQTQEGASLDPDQHWLDFPNARAVEGDAPEPGEFFLTSVTYSEGAFYLVLRDNDDGDGDPLVDSDDRIIVYVTASFPDGTQRQIESLVHYNPGNWVPNAAILVDGQLDNQGNLEVRGSLGSVHANGELELGGNPTIEQDATSALAVTASGSPTVGGTMGVMSVAPIPDIDVTGFRADADFILAADGNVYNAAGAVISMPEFRFRGGDWDLHVNTAIPVGSYYVETDLRITGRPNVTASFFVEGSITVTGDPTIRPYHNDVGAIVSGDLQVSGTPSGLWEGFYYAREQLCISGNAQLAGSFVAKNALDNSNAVTTGSRIDPSAATVIGNPVVTYNGGLNTAIDTGGSVTVETMRRLK